MRKVWVILGSVVLVLLVLLLAGAGVLMLSSGFAPLMMGGYGVRGVAYGGGLGVVLVGLLFRLLFWAVVIGGIVWLIAWATGGSRQPAASMPARETPVDILKMRFAKGEITKEQYEQLKHDLEA